MKKFLLILLVPLFMGCTEKADIKVLSLNIRYDNPGDGRNAWPYRKDLVVNFLDSSAADIFGLQEVLWHQYLYIDSLMPDYGSLAAGRNDGQESGEMTPVFYLKSRFELEESNTFWLSETPSVPGSRGWGAVLPRIVSWVKLHDRELNKDLYFFNTHFSHMSDSARLMSAGILAEQVTKITGGADFIISGDFNMSPDSKAYKALLKNESANIVDSYIVSENDPAGPDGTFNGFSANTRPGRIDYIFVKNGISVLSHKTLEISQDTVIISDHWPLVVKIGLK